MSLLLKHDWDDTTVNWLEEHLQQAIVMRCRQRPDYKRDFVIVGDMNAAKRSKHLGARLKAAGMQTGEPDLRLYFAGAWTLFIELKRIGNKVNEAQIEWHKQLADLGFTVCIVTTQTPNEAVEYVMDIIDNIYGVVETP